MRQPAPSCATDRLCRKPSFSLTLVCYAVFSVIQNVYDCCDALHLEFVYTACVDISDILHVAGWQYCTAIKVDECSTLRQTTVNGIGLLRGTNPYPSTTRSYYRM